MTSGEYAYDLLRRLQRHFRCTDSGHRMYLYYFFCDLFNDPSVLITEEAHKAFVTQMEKDSATYAEKGLTSLEDISNSSESEESFVMLQQSFAGIGIDLQKVESGFSGKLVFTLPSGEVKELQSSQGLSSSYLCARTGVVLAYAEDMMPFYEFAGQPLQDLANVDANVAGYGTQWTYDGAGELAISGAGSLASINLFSDLGIKSGITTMILGAGVTRFLKDSLKLTKDATLVFLHGSADEVVFDKDFSGTSSSEEILYNYTVYTDCEAVKNAAFHSVIKVTFRPLSEWSGS